MFILGASLASCHGGERPFLQVQFCLTEDAGANELKQMLRQIAQSEGMKFTDRSSQAEAELRSLGDLPQEVSQSFPLIVVNVQGRDGYGVGGGNMGLTARQVGLGFSPDSAEARRFARRTVQRLQQRWKLVRVPEDRGMFPLRNCPP